jgi:lipid-A-disaccharide synthase-like uncharacterized protein
MLLGLLGWDWFVHEIQRPLVIFGFAAQFVFFLRFVVQWFASERRGRSHIPIAFWYLSLAGGLMTFVYALLEKNLVFMTAQALGVMIYVRNLMLIYRRHARVSARRRRGRTKMIFVPTLIPNGENLEDPTPVPEPRT